MPQAGFEPSFTISPSQMISIITKRSNELSHHGWFTSKKYVHIHVAFNVVQPPLPTPVNAGLVFFCRKKFSVRHFWEDCRRYNCNGAQYIGEICRYILSAPETPDEKLHKVDIMIGNGLRPPIWDQVCL